MWYSTVISSAEREAAYVIDGLMHNNVVKSDIHSTDTHGYSEVIFGSTYFFGLEFAPRIKGLHKQHLYAFKPRKHYEEQEIAETCRRLIKNAIICWNYLYFSRELAAKKMKNEKQNYWKQLKIGEFDFSDEKMQDSVGLLSPKKSPSKTP